MSYFADNVCCLSTDGIRCLRRIDVQCHGPKGQYVTYRLEAAYKGVTYLIEYGDLKDLRDEMYSQIVRRLTLPSVRAKKAQVRVEDVEETRG